MPSEYLRADDPDTAKVERHRARYAKAIELAEIDGGLWLDCACGTGYGTVMMAEAGAETVWAVDRDEDARAAASALWKADWPDANAIFAWCDIRDAVEWMGDTTFDGILCIETLEHLEWPDQKEWIKQCAAHLKADGVLVIACPIGNGPNPDNPWHLHEPSTRDLEGYMRPFASVSYFTEDYESTSGPAQQVFAVARYPIEKGD